MSDICRKRDSRSPKCRAILKGQIKMTVINNKVVENLEAGSAVIYNARGISNLQGHKICFAYSTKKRTIAVALG